MFTKRNSSGVAYGYHCFGHLWFNINHALRSRSRNTSSSIAYLLLSLFIKLLDTLRINLVAFSYNRGKVVLINYHRADITRQQAEPLVRIHHLEVKVKERPYIVEMQLRSWMGGSFTFLQFCAMLRKMNL